MMLARLVGLPSIGESIRNGVDYTSNLLGGFIFPVLANVVDRVLLVVSVFLDLLLHLFFCLCLDFYVDPLGVLQVSLLLGGCLAS